MKSVREVLVRYSKSVSVLFHGRYALWANTVSGGALFMIGDVIQQKIEIERGKHTKYDWERVARITTVGFLMGPPHHYFYKYLDVLLPQRNKGTIVKKILADQLIACPMFSIQFFMGMAYLEGKDIQVCWNEFKKKFPTVYMVDWLCWPPFQLVNFYLIPTGFRVLYVNTVTTFWNVFLSYMKHYDQFDSSPDDEQLGIFEEGKKVISRFFSDKPPRRGLSDCN